jgi:hypothetical protein
MMLVPALAGAQVNNANGTVSCGTILKASVKPKPSLTNAGGLATVLYVKGTLGGCSSGDTAVTFPEGKSKFKGTINAVDNGCAGLAGPSTGTGTITITWGTVPAVTNKVSTVNIPVGGAVGNFGVFASDLHGTFGLGSPYGAAALSVTGGFAGNDAGASSGATIITQESVNSILAGCGAAAGLKVINLGLMGINLG